MQSSYDTNIRLEDRDEIEALGGVLSPEFKLGRRTEALDLNLFGRIDASAFAGESELDSVDERLLFTVNRKTLRGKYGVGVDYNRDTTLTTEETDTGRFTETARVETFAVAPSWSHQFTAVDNLDLTGSYVDTRYDTDLLTPFRFLSGTGNWTHAMGPRDSLIGAAFIARFEADDASDTVSDIAGFQLGWNHQFSERLRAQGSAGLEHVTTRFDSPAGRDEDTTLGYRIELNLSFAYDERTKIDLTGSRRTEPSGGGTVVTRNRAQLSLSRRLTEQLTMKTDASFIENESDTRNSLEQRTFVAFQPSLTWNFERDWDVTASYRFRAQEFEGDDLATSNAAFVTLTYRLPRMSWSE